MNEPIIDLADPRNIPAELRGKPVVLSPDGVGGITIADANGRPFWVGDLAEERDELKFSGDLADMNGRRADLTDGLTDDELELYRAWERFVAGGAPPESTDAPDAANLSGTDDGDENDGYSDDGLFDAWKEHAIGQGYDLSETDAATPTLEIGQSVTWGKGNGAAHGILMELDTAEGTANVHTCEVVTEGGAGPQLSPTGRTIKVDAGKLRKTSLVLVGEEPIGPERASMSADLSDEDPGVGTDADDDATFWTKVQRSLKRMGGGFGA